jgi:hypothetical protein
VVTTVNDLFSFASPPVTYAQIEALQENAPFPQSQTQNRKPTNFPDANRAGRSESKPEVSAYPCAGGDRRRQTETAKVC